MLLVAEILALNITQGYWISITAYILASKVLLAVALTPKSTTSVSGLNCIQMKIVTAVSTGNIFDLF